MYQVQCARRHWMQIPAESLGERVLCPTCHTFVTLPAGPDGQPLEPRYDYQCKHGHQLRVKAKYLGREIRCPECQVLVTIRGKTALGLPPEVLLAEPATAPPAPRPTAPRSPAAPTIIDNIPVAEVDHAANRRPAKRVRDMVEEDEEELDPAAARLDRHVMRRHFGIVDTGLGIIKWSLIIAVGAVVIMTMLTILVTLMALMGIVGAGFGKFYLMVVYALLAVVVLCLVPGLAGLGMQLVVPWRSGATPWAAGSFASLLAVPFVIYWFLSNHWWAQPGVMIVGGADLVIDGQTYTERIMLGLLMQAISCIPWVLFMLYLRQLAVFLRKNLYRSDALFLLALGLALVAFMDFLQFLMSFLHGAPQGIAIAVGLFFLLASCVCLVLLTFKHVTLLDNLRYAMSRKW